jgi:16S rRNA (cytidine1402-2'-O)-methyltransferase
MLQVVATPIGNLGDLTPRALQVLGQVSVIAAEDTRVSGRLLRSRGVSTPLVSLHEHNEGAVAPRLVERMAAGESVALVSDAGTPLVSDPGYLLVALAHDRGIPVRAVAGPSALTAALSVAGLPTDRFVFEGFLPARGGPRRARLADLAAEPRTLAFYEAPHRLQAMLADAAEALGPQRPATLCRELTKLHEEVRRSTLEGLAQELAQRAERPRGEIVLVVGGCPPAAAPEGAPDADRVLALLLEELPVKRAAALAAKLTGGARNDLYRRALALRDADG